MQRRARIRYTENERALMWERWQKGDLRFQPVDATHYTLAEWNGCCKWREDQGFATRKARRRSCGSAGRKGDTLHQIAALFDRHHPSIRRVLAASRGVRPRERRQCQEENGRASEPKTPSAVRRRLAADGLRRSGSSVPGRTGLGASRAVGLAGPSGMGRVKRTHWRPTAEAAITLSRLRRLVGWRVR